MQTGTEGTEVGTAQHEADAGQIRTSIEDRYTRAARTIMRSVETEEDGRLGTIGADDTLLEAGPNFGSARYAASELGRLPRLAVRASLGCGSPTADAPLERGQVVVDVGCGGAIDAILAAGAVAPTGRVIGIDLSTAMIELAQRNAAQAGASHLVFAVGLMENLPLRSETVDIVISNAAIHLTIDKERAIAELFRVLRPGGRLHVLDIVADDSLSLAEHRERISSTNTTAGVLSISKYRWVLARAGFSGIVITPDHAVADRMTATLVTAVRPASQQNRRDISL